MLPALRKIAKRHGYALAVHGSEVRDLDLVAVPWIDEAKPEADLIKAIAKATGGIIGNNWKTDKPRGRRAYTICFFDDRYVGMFLDISVVGNG
jgi:hypothetical protein